jgi:hypothetical protein
MENKKLILIFFGILMGVSFSLFVININFIRIFSNENSGFITLLSVLIIITTFIITRIWDKNKEYKRQINLLHALARELEFPIEDNLDWIQKEKATDHFAHEIDPSFYNKNLDVNLLGGKVKGIVKILFQLKDKIKLVNYYAKEIRDYIYNEWKLEKEGTNFSEWVKNKNYANNHYISFFIDKQKGPMEEAKDFIKKIKGMINKYID